MPRLKRLTALTLLDDVHSALIKTLTGFDRPFLISTLLLRCLSIIGEKALDKQSISAVRVEDDQREVRSWSCRTVQPFTYCIDSLESCQ